MTRVLLHPDMFADNERVVAEHGGWRVATFRFRSGVAAMRVTDGPSEVVILPYQDQQIWSARLDGRDVGMVFDESRPAQDFLDTMTSREIEP
jgi:hypothetical protein